MSSMFPHQELPSSIGGFEILERLGRGGTGDVFLAKSPGGKRVAIKVLAPDGGDEAFRETLAREASLCVRLNHPAIVQVRAFVEDGSLAALVFEYVEGIALVRLLRFCAAHGMRLPDRAAWHVVERVLAALAYAHAQTDERHLPAPIVHRDVSPANVLVDWTGTVKLADFGMAKMLGVSPVTRVGIVKGTLGCMAPEQARGEAVTERADVYAAALLAWRLATGRTPFAKFKDDEVELLRAMRNPRLRPLAALRPDLPEAVLAAVTRALEPEVGARTISADELRVAIKTSIDVEAGHAELAEVLTRWRPTLVQILASREESTGGRDGEGGRTSRYDEAALAYEEDQGHIDGPTFETYSLPSDAAIPVTMPVEGPPRVVLVTPPVAFAPKRLDAPLPAAPTVSAPRAVPSARPESQGELTSVDAHELQRELRSGSRTRLLIVVAVVIGVTGGIIAALSSQ